MKTKTIFFILCSILLLVGCAAGPNTLMDVPSPDGTIAGFWLGLWHGLISPVTFLISLFCNDVSVYAANNTGGWYDFSFLWGAGGVVLISTRVGCNRDKKTRSF